MSAFNGTAASMTGFARAVGRSEPYGVLWELRTVNARGLDLRLRVPAGHDALEAQARALLTQRLNRGACHATLTLEREASPTVRVNTDLLMTLLKALEAVPVNAAVRGASIDGLLGVRGVIEFAPDAGAADDAADFLPDIMAVLSVAVDALVTMRRNEGQYLVRVLQERLATIERLTTDAAGHPSRHPEAIRARLTRSLEALLDAGPSLDPNRLHQEAVLLAAKADIQEEVDRLRAHVAAARGLLSDGGLIGRRLDFLSQEFAREANTLCAKASDVALTAIGLDLKSEIDQLREQVQNVE